MTLIVCFRRGKEVGGNRLSAHLKVEQFYGPQFINFFQKKFIFANVPLLKPQISNQKVEPEVQVHFRGFFGFCTCPCLLFHF